MNDGWISRNSSGGSRKRDRDRAYDDNWGTYEARGSGRSGSKAFRLPEQALSSPSLFQTGNRPSDGKLTRLAEGKRVGVPHGSDNSSRLRIPDNRGAAARMGSLPAESRSTSFQSSASKFNGKNIVFQNSDFIKSVRNPPTITEKLPEELNSSLNEEQRLVVESVLSGHSTFFTGPAGSGKSHILKSIIKANNLGIGGRNGQPRKIVVTATTGVAACNVGGITIHSFAGVGSSSASSADMVRRVMSNEYAKQRWREVDVLVIDEVSMMASSFLDKLSFIASRARNDRRPFGGVQLVVCGDFFQLPPVELKNDGFAFMAKCWSDVIKCSVLLRQVFRQQGDATLMKILDEARIGELTSHSVDVLRRHSTLPSAAFERESTSEETKKIIPTLLECRNKEVDKANEREMQKLPGQVYTFHARDRAISDSYCAQLKHCQAPAQLDLKIGAQVILLKNIDLERGLANGSRGIVVRFQAPKSEGDVPTGFKNLEFPVIRFATAKSSGNNDEDKEFTIRPEEWQNKMGEQTVSSRVQIPSDLHGLYQCISRKGQFEFNVAAHIWGKVTISHTLSGYRMTIPNLTVNLAGVFEYGQAYVALSRATELRLLTLRGFSMKAFRAHPQVKEFYRVLEQGASLTSNDTNKENDYGEQIDATAQFEDQTSKNPYCSGTFNPYVRGKRPSVVMTKDLSKHPFKMQSTIPGYNQATVPVETTVSPSLTQDQLQRMEENRLRALAIRKEKQRNSSSNA
eukprot:CAMPEP_0171426446 /NCGR_PEP_ID=MMETSP0881-20121228/3966_1 /TAXON_ID=67004 /ORGANISM="Thalassiosira weissflogii, Strain CCMP1336" /LENGTH=741 /DNA_ID=CAMNT_0011945929 /DNA_START=57 /DNA_END=2282 /DNA_ORIENTATION=+